MTMLYITLISFFLSFQCFKEKNCHNSIDVKNKSNKRIYVDRCGEYPDTLSLRTHSTIYELQNRNYLYSRSCIEYAFQGENKIKSDTMMVYIFDADIIDKTPWDTVSKYHLYLKRYDLSLADLQKSNWTITYP